MDIESVSKVDQGSGVDLFVREIEKPKRSGYSLSRRFK
jgi:hypothetical protein